MHKMGFLQSMPAKATNITLRKNVSIVVEKNPQRGQRRTISEIAEKAAQSTLNMRTNI